jgi:hypothetical protein
MKKRKKRKRKKRKKRKKKKKKDRKMGKNSAVNIHIRVAQGWLPTVLTKRIYTYTFTGIRYKGPRQERDSNRYFQ